MKGVRQVSGRLARGAFTRICSRDINAPVRRLHQRYNAITIELAAQSVAALRTNDRSHVPRRDSRASGVRAKSTHATQSPIAHSDQAEEELPNSTPRPDMPDVTNYYTLFPQTLAHGPPQRASRLTDSLKPDDRKTSEAKFYINSRDLRREFLQLQSLHHPDKYPAGSVAHRKAYALSTLLNNAYKTLSDPLLRAQYLLQLLYSIDVTSEDNSAHPTDTETLMIVMEAQEELETARGEKAQAMVDRLIEKNSARIREAEEILEEAFQQGRSETARSETVKLKYWKSLESGLKDWEPGKDIRLTH